MARVVTEADFRKPEFIGAKPEDYEFREDGALVRKDRWERGIHSIVRVLGMNGREFEIADVVEAVRQLREVAVFLAGTLTPTLVGAESYAFDDTSIGVSRAGTTSLYRTIVSKPQGMEQDAWYQLARRVVELMDEHASERSEG